MFRLGATFSGRGGGRRVMFHLAFTQTKQPTHTHKHTQATAHLRLEFGSFVTPHTLSHSLTHTHTLIARPWGTIWDSVFWPRTPPTYLRVGVGA